MVVEKQIKPRGWVDRLTPLLMTVIVICGFALRVWNIQYDGGMNGHPDERSTTCGYAPSMAMPTSWDQFMDPKLSPLNPMWSIERQERRSFTYGHFPLYLGVAMGELFHVMTPTVSALGAPVWMVERMERANTPCEGVAIPGRFTIALLDTLTIFLLFLLGRRIYGNGAGILAAALYAFTAQAIQLSHFFAMDPASTTFTVLAILGAVKMVQQRTLSAALLTGIGCGLAISSKFSALPILAAPVVAGILALWLDATRNSQLATRNSQSTIRNPQFAIILGIPLALLVAILSFAITSPYAILDASSFLQATLVEQGRMVRGLADMPFTRQYRNTTPYLYFLQQQLEWGLGYPLGIVAGLGALFAFFQAVGSVIKLLLGRSLSKVEIGVLLMWSWVLPYFGLTGAFMAKFNRYMSPILPFAVLWAAGLCALLWNVGRDRMTRWQGDKGTNADEPIPSSPRPLVPLSKSIAALLALIALLGGIFWSAAYVNGVYRQPHPWMTAAIWMKDNVPPGSVILCEQWDDCLPFGSFGNPEVDMIRGGYQYTDWGPYEEDTAEKYAIMKAKLSAATHVIYSSKRIWDSVDELPTRYPMTNLYYRSMFDGSLGFELVSAVETYPKLFGFEFPDKDADESWSLYDHPQPLIFKKVRQLSDAEFDAKFAGSWEGAVAWYRGEDSPLSPFLNRLGLGNTVESENAALINKVIGLLTGQEAPKPPPTPEQLESLLLKTPLDEMPVVDNYRWNKTASENTALSILWWWVVVTLLGWVAWPLAFYIFAPLRDRGFFLSRALGLLLAGWLLWIAASVGWLNNTVVNSWLMVAVVGLFSLIALVAQRKQMGEFVRRQWWLILSAEVIFAAAFLFFVLLRLGNPDIWQPWQGGEKFMEFAFVNGILRSPTFPPLDPHYAGGTINYYYFGLYLVAYLIKLTGIYAEVAFNLAIPTLFALTVVNTFAVAYSALTPRATAQVSCLGQLAKAGLAPIFVVLIGNLDGFALVVRNLANYGSSSFESSVPGLQQLVMGFTGLRAVITTDLPMPSYNFWSPSRVIDRGLTINEFPYWSFLFADLHPHLIGIPMAAFFIAVMLVVLREEGDLLGKRWLRGLGLLALFSLLLGTLASINLWELPTYLGLGVLTFLVAQYRWHGRINWLLTAIVTLLYAAGAYALYYPFFDNFIAVAAGGVGLVRKPDDTGEWLLIWGFLGFVVVSWLCYEAARPVVRWKASRSVDGETVDGETVDGRMMGTDEAFSEDVALPSAKADDSLTQTPLGKFETDIILPEVVVSDTNAINTSVIDSSIDPQPTLSETLPDIAESTTLPIDPQSIINETTPNPQSPISNPKSPASKPGGIERWLSLATRYFDRLPRLVYLESRLVEHPGIGYLASQALLPLLALLTLIVWWWGKTVLALCLLPMGLAWLLLWRRGRQADEGSSLTAVLAVTGLAVLAGTQVVYLKDFLSGGDFYRMNTLFKFFSQVWVIWGIAAAIGAARVWDEWVVGRRETVDDGRWMGEGRMESAQSASRIWRGAWATIFSLLFAASFAFLIWGTPARLDDRFPNWRPPFGTLNGLDYMNEGVFSWPDENHPIELKYDRLAITWLLDNIRGNPIIAESTMISYYRESGTRAATMTGISGLLGFHKNEQYFDPLVAARNTIFSELWQTPDVARTQQVLEELDVALIYVGQLERYENATGVAKFEAMAAQGQLETLYQNEKTTIYAVPGKLTQTAQGYYVPSGVPALAAK